MRGLLVIISFFMSVFKEYYLIFRGSNFWGGTGLDEKSGLTSLFLNEMSLMKRKKLDIRFFFSQRGK